MPISATNSPDPRVCRDPFPFRDHPTLAQVAARHRLTAAKLRGVILSVADATLLAALNRGARPPTYPDSPPDAA